MKTLWIVFYLITYSVFCQDVKAEADKSYSNNDWSSAAKAYQKYLKQNDKDSLAWYRLASCEYELGKYPSAITHFDKALELNFYPGFTLYAKSKAQAQLNQMEDAFSSLKSAANEGFGNFKLLETDEVWADYQDNDQLLTIKKSIKINAYPCLGDDRYRHFDFWIGEWDVYANGRKVGENSITMANGGCAIHESYTTPGAYTGQSINYYDKMDEKWHQTWVGSAGGVLDYVEIDKSEGMLHFQCDYMNQQGQVVKSRLTFTLNEDGTVRQLFENSSDGKKWTPGFDGLYKRKN
jgi:tetratricopeptide (TPR) repeat protein